MAFKWIQSPSPFLYMYAQVQLSGESLLNCVTLLLAEVGQPYWRRFKVPHTICWYWKYKVLSRPGQVKLLCTMHTSSLGLEYLFTGKVWLCFVHTVKRHKPLFSYFEAVVSFSTVLDLTTDVCTLCRNMHMHINVPLRLHSTVYCLPPTGEHNRFNLQTAQK